MGGGKPHDDIASLQADNAELKKQLGSKVWTMTLAAVAELEKLAMDGASSAERVTLPYRIANLERAVFGATASEEDLNKIGKLQTEHQQLLQDYEKLADEYQELKDQPPQVVQSSESVQVLEEQLRKLQERYQTMQQKLSKLRVEHLDLQSGYQQLQAEHEKLKGDSAQIQKQQSGQIGRLRKDQEKLAQELQEVRSAHSEAQAQLAVLKKEKAKLLQENLQQRDYESEMARLQGEYAELLSEFHQLQDDHEELQGKSDRFRSTLHGVWGADEVADSNHLTLPPLSPASRSQTPSADKARSLSNSKSESRIPGLQETKEARFPASLLEPAGPLKVEQLKTRLMEIKGRVLYCNDMEKPPESPKPKMALSVYDAW